MFRVIPTPNYQTFQTLQFHHLSSASLSWRFTNLTISRVIPWPDRTCWWPILKDPVVMILVVTLSGLAGAQPKWYLPFLFQLASPTTSCSFSVRTHYRRAPVHHGHLDSKVNDLHLVKHLHKLHYSPILDIMYCTVRWLWGDCEVAIICSETANQQWLWYKEYHTCKM